MRFSVVLGILLYNINLASAYNLYEKTGHNVRWADQYIDIVLDDSLLDIGSEDDIEIAVIYSIELWSRDAHLPMIWNIEWGNCDRVPRDLINCIVASDEGLDRPATSWIDTDPSSVIDGFVEIYGIDINIDPNDEWNFGNTHDTGYSLPYALAHEFGHAIGLDHSDDPDAIMYAFFDSDYEAFPFLTDDDLAGAKYLYDSLVFDDSASGCSVSFIGFDNTSISVIDLLSALL